MSDSVLVAYATRSGSTQEVAETVAATLREAGLHVDCQPLRSTRSLAGYRMVVLGAPLYMFKWHKDAFAFLSRHRSALEKLPIAAFALGPFNDVEKEWEDVRALFDKELMYIYRDYLSQSEMVAGTPPADATPGAAAVAGDAAVTSAAEAGPGAAR